MALSYFMLMLMFNLPLVTKSSQQHKTARHCRTLMESSIGLLILCIANNIIVLLLDWLIGV